MDKKKINRLLENAEDQMRNQLTDYEEKRSRQTQKTDEKAVRKKKIKQDKREVDLNKFLKENKMRLTKAQQKYALDVDWVQFGYGNTLSAELIIAIRNQYKHMQDFLDSGG